MVYSSQRTKMWIDFTDDGMNVILPGPAIHWLRKSDE